MPVQAKVKLNSLQFSKIRETKDDSLIVAIDVFPSDSPKYSLGYLLKLSPLNGDNLPEQRRGNNEQNQESKNDSTGTSLTPAATHLEVQGIVGVPRTESIQKIQSVTDNKVLALNTSSSISSSSNSSLAYIAKSSTNSKPAILLAGSSSSSSWQVSQLPNSSSSMSSISSWTAVSELTPVRVGNSNDFQTLLENLVIPNTIGKDFLNNLGQSLAQEKVVAYQLLFRPKSSALPALYDITYQGRPLDSVEEEGESCRRRFTVFPENVSKEDAERYPAVTRLVGGLCGYISTLQSMFPVLMLPTPDDKPLVIKKPGSNKDVLNPEIGEYLLQMIGADKTLNELQINEMYEIYGNRQYQVTCDADEDGKHTFYASSIPDYIASLEKELLKKKCIEFQRKKKDGQDCRLHTEWKDDKEGHLEMMTEAVWEEETECCVISTMSAYHDQGNDSVYPPAESPIRNISKACTTGLSEGYTTDKPINFFGFCCERSFKVDEGED